VYLGVSPRASQEGSRGLVHNHPYGGLVTHVKSRVFADATKPAEVPFKARTLPQASEPNRSLTWMVVD
jgi:hypothetical protein